VPSDSKYLTLQEQAAFLAARSIAYATAHLDGRDDAQALFVHASSLQNEIMMCWAGIVDIHVNATLDPVRLLVVAMRRAAMAEGEERQQRWQHVMGALVEMVRHESAAMRGAPAGRPAAEVIETAEGYRR
jgi:hypothetical protein